MKKIIRSTVAILLGSSAIAAGTPASAHDGQITAFILGTIVGGVAGQNLQTPAPQPTPPPIIVQNDPPPVINYYAPHMHMHQWRDENRWHSERDRASSPARIVVPGYCGLTVDIQQGPEKVYLSHCLENAGLGSFLPYHCAFSINLDSRMEQVFGKACLINNGFDLN